MSQKVGFLISGQKVGDFLSFVDEETGMEIIIVIHEVRGKWVKLAIKAPRRVKINRDAGARRPIGSAPGSSGGNGSAGPS